jgi:Type IX secretion system protein PorV
MKRIFQLVLSIIIIFISFTGKPIFAQISGGDEILNVVTTAVPFLRIAPDARSGGMGDVGISVSPDANGWFWNPAKMAFVEKDFGFAVTYTPWLRQLVNDIYMASLYGFKKIDDMQAIGGSLRYFSLGTINFTDNQGIPLGQFSPNEFALDAGYSRKLSDVFSSGVMLRFIYSNLASGRQINGVDIRPGTSVAVDISFQYQNKIKIGETDATLAIGTNISNLGSKITYTDDATNKDYIPANLAIGASLNLEIDDYNELLFALDINKLLVPTPVPNGSHKNQSVPASIINSFGDAPGGFSEELKELMFSAGVEYWYDKQFAVRTGYFYENRSKGARQFLTVGLGLKYNVFGLDFSYLIPTSGNRNPLDNTLRFTLKFDFDAITKSDNNS